MRGGRSLQRCGYESSTSWRCLWRSESGRHLASVARRSGGRAREDSRPQNLVHLEHINFVGVEDGSEVVVAEDLAFVGRVLEVVVFDIYPELFDDLGPGHAVRLEKYGQRLTGPGNVIADW